MEFRETRKHFRQRALPVQRHRGGMCLMYSGASKDPMWLEECEGGGVYRGRGRTEGNKARDKSHGALMLW